MLSRDITRRELLRRAGQAAALAIGGRLLPPAGWIWPRDDARAQVPRDPYTVETLEAFADTLIPGRKRSPDDRAVAGVVKGPGAVQAGAIEMWYFPPLQSEGSAPPFASTLNAWARARFPSTAVVPPEFVALDFDQRTDLLYTLYDPASPDRQFWVVGAAIVFLAFHTAGFLPTERALKEGHPGLRFMRFPKPGRDGLYRFPQASYGRALNRRHPRTARRGHPA